MHTYLVHFDEIEWDTGAPGEHPAAADLPSKYTVTIEADNYLDAYCVAGNRMSDNTGFLFYGANATITRV